MSPDHPRVQPRRRLARAALAAALAAAVCAPLKATLTDWTDATLWQESSYWDALLAARDAAARQEADPNLLPVVRSISSQADQQAANIRLIRSYVRAQEDNLRFALGPRERERSLATIRANLDTLARGSDRVRGNLHYLTTRCRLAAGQALPDPELVSAVEGVLARLETVRSELDSLLAEAAGLEARVHSEESLARDLALRFRTRDLSRAASDARQSLSLADASASDLRDRAR